MSADHREILELLGSYAVGALSAAERADVEWHVEGCVPCAAELAHVQRVADRLLDLDARGAGHRVPDLPRPQSARQSRPTPLRPVPSPDPQAADRLFGRLARERSRENRRRRWAAVSSISAVAAAMVAVVVLYLPTREAEEPDLPPAVPLTFEVVPAGVTASAELRDWGWGTQMRLEIDGLSDDQDLTAWLERPDGTRVPAGSFRSTGDALTMMLGAGANTDEATALGVSDAGGTTLLRASLD
jgi:anti-sigma-K factor RskA